MFENVRKVFENEIAHATDLSSDLPMLQFFVHATVDWIWICACYSSHSLGFVHATVYFVHATVLPN